ncbi:MAG: hypothetical protein JO099_08075 [Acidobacteriia bacterium]|nr:hypothetical protein [Terriglobia bacterium]
MSLLTFAQWVQSTELFTAIRESWYVYPAIMSSHLAGISLFGGMVLVVDLRLLGLAMRKRPVADVMRPLRRLKWIGFAIVATCGILMLGSKAEEYYYNAFFRAKMAVLALIFAHGLFFRGSVYGKVAEFDKTGKIPGRAKLAASLSLILWTCMVICGRGIGYIEPPLDKIHARLIERHHQRTSFYSPSVMSSDFSSPEFGFVVNAAPRRQMRIVVKSPF